MERFDRSYYDEEPEVEVTRKQLEDLANSGDEMATIDLAFAKINGDTKLKIERNTTEAVNLLENLVKDTGDEKKMIAANAHHALGIAYY